jgi:hypothetical protein
MVEDVNETVSERLQGSSEAHMKHVEAWSEMLSKSNPPIGSSPITPFLGEHAFRSELSTAYSFADPQSWQYA